MSKKLHKFKGAIEGTDKKTITGRQPKVTGTVKALYEKQFAYHACVGSIEIGDGVAAIDTGEETSDSAGLQRCCRPPSNPKQREIKKILQPRNEQKLEEKETQSKTDKQSEGAGG